MIRIPCRQGSGKPFSSCDDLRIHPLSIDVNQPGIELFGQFHIVGGEKSSLISYEILRLKMAAESCGTLPGGRPGRSGGVHLQLLIAFKFPMTAALIPDGIETPVVAYDLGIPGGFLSDLLVVEFRRSQFGIKFLDKFRLLFAAPRCPVWRCYCVNRNSAEIFIHLIGYINGNRQFYLIWIIVILLLAYPRTAQPDRVADDFRGTVSPGGRNDLQRLERLLTSKVNRLINTGGYEQKFSRSQQKGLIAVIVRNLLVQFHNDCLPDNGGRILFQLRGRIRAAADQHECDGKSEQ